MQKLVYLMMASLFVFTACKKDKTQEDNKENEGGRSADTGLVIHTGIACIDALANDMVKVQGGTFVMGSADDDTDAYNDEKPQHSVTLSDFYICKYEVTQELWEAVMGSTPTANGGWTDKYGKGDKYPAYYISWNDCDTFLQKLNTKTGLKFRFPTEAEWEYAARGGNKADTTKYAGSNMIDVVAWHNGNSGNIAHTCGTKRANALGIYDMTGNVWEWCSDWYSSTYYNESANSTDPKGPPSRTKCVSRGGSWHNDARFCRVAYRYCCTPSARYSNQGFRVVLQ